MDDKILDKIREFAKGEKDVVALYLFGSKAKGTDNKESDYDIAVFVKNKSEINIRDLYKKISARFPDPEKLQLTFVDLFNSSPLLLYQIIKYGKLLYEKKKNLFVNLEAMIMRLYFDDEHRRDIYFNYFEKKYAH